MSLPKFIARSVSKIIDDPRKANRIFDRRYWRYFYWVARFGSMSDLHESRWRFSGDVAQRRYKTYDDYKVHQSSKIDDPAFRRKLESLEEDQYNGFRRRFAVAPEIAGKRTVLCLGARLGTEVRALRDMGYFAVGVDLNPGGENRFVLWGDFHNLAFGDESVDVVYTNVLDHAFDLAKVTSEISRVLHSSGVALVEIIRGTEEGYLPQEYEAIAWKTARGFAESLADLSGMRLLAFRTPEDMNDSYWSQAIFGKA